MIFATFDLLISFLDLHGQSPEKQDALLDQMRQRNPIVILADWQDSERNLHLPATTFVFVMTKIWYWLTRNKQKSESFRRYYRNGALEGILYQYREQVIVRERLSVWGGCLGLALIEWKENPN